MKYFNRIENMKFILTSQRSVSLDCGNKTDKCVECDVGKVINTCNKCGNGVCKQSKCHLSFPHNYDTTFVICKNCYDKIDNQLINYDHLIIYKFLKKNIRRRRISC